MANITKTLSGFCFHNESIYTGILPTSTKKKFFAQHTKNRTVFCLFYMASVLILLVFVLFPLSGGCSTLASSSLVTFFGLAFSFFFSLALFLSFSLFQALFLTFSIPFSYHAPLNFCLNFFIFQQNLNSTTPNLIFVL